MGKDDDEAAAQDEQTTKKLLEEQELNEQAAQDEQTVLAMQDARAAQDAMQTAQDEQTVLAAERKLLDGQKLHEQEAARREEAEREARETDETLLGQEQTENAKTLPANAQASDLNKIASITVINGLNGDRKSFRIEESNRGFKDLLVLYKRLDTDGAQVKHTTRLVRSGYSYCMELFDEKGQLLHFVTPYEDGFSIDNTFYSLANDDGSCRSAINLMDYISGIFYPPADDRSGTELLAYITGFNSEKEIRFDEVEWVEVPSERAVELGITEEDAPGGFYIYNGDDTGLLSARRAYSSSWQYRIETYPVAKACVCKILDWEDGYKEKEISVSEMMRIIKERPFETVPYHIQIQKSEVVAITEQYVP